MDDLKRIQELAGLMEKIDVEDLKSLMEASINDKFSFVIIKQVNSMMSRACLELQKAHKLMTDTVKDQSTANNVKQLFDPAIEDVRRALVNLQPYTGEKFITD